MAEPTHLSEIPADTDVSAYERGLQMLGQAPTVQGRVLAGVLEAKCSDGTPLYPTVGVLMPRRSTKTTTLWAVLLGRCALIPGYRVVTTAQDGTRAGNIMRERMRELEAHGFEEGIGQLRWSNGRERIEFDNGSVIWVVAPSAGAFRSEAADVELFDEAGELSVEKSADLQAGALPLLDTRPMGQAIVAGTPSKSRAGLLWQTLQDGRGEQPEDEELTGIVDYSIRDDEEAVDLDDEGNLIGLNEAVLLRVHPGLTPDADGRTLTTLRKMRARFKAMGRAQFEREYLCRFPIDASTDAIASARWAAAKVERTERPERVGVAFDCAYDSTSASIVYAWRDEDGNAMVEVVAHELGTGWVAAAAHRAARVTGCPVAHDDIGANRDPATALARLRKPTPKVERLQMKDIMGAASRLVNEVNAGRLRHFGQDDLDAAVGNLTWRDVSKSGRAFGPKDYSGAPISPIVAASLALWSYDRRPERKRLAIVAA
ncbi:hypothetical protein ICW40_01190 [Actinotalea ferrariae]|uniref:hypothetical protein n=1 Tax=Actinotalea ferrariae TaxID=1386098 RepID=UPI001C8BE908|nr:hypothetical protein [Actinotalea ferrariae]MBX9243420.1 hypothetical protein [Actinotalea ferrariae]